MGCPKFDVFAEAIQKVDQAKALELDKRNPLSFNIWFTQQEHIAEVIKNYNLPNSFNINQNSPAILRKITYFFSRKDKHDINKKFIKNVIESETAIEKVIALKEVIDTVEGEVNKARENGFDIKDLSENGLIPNIPLSRTAASIGRKILFKRGYVFAKTKNEDTAATIEKLYLDIGMEAINSLSDYLSVHKKGKPFIKDYLNKNQLKDDYPEINVIANDAETISLNLDSLSIPTDAKSKEASYFLDKNTDLRNLEKTKFGFILSALKTANYLTQPVEYLLPDSKKEKKTKGEDLIQEGSTRELDQPMQRAFEKLYNNPLYINNALKPLYKALSDIQKDTGESASSYLNSVFKRTPNMLKALFGIKDSDNYGIDKKQSIEGQNKSKTAPLDDLIDFYDELTGSLHLPMRTGRNDRGVYRNTVLNPHTSKHSRHALTGNPVEVEVDTPAYNKIIYGIHDTLNGFTFDEITGKTESKLDDLLKIFQEYKKGGTAASTINTLKRMISVHPNTNYVNLITALQAVEDVRNKQNGKIKTNFFISTDVTASGGTITFAQALGTNPKISEFFERTGIFESNREVDLADLYGLLSEAINGYINNDNKTIIEDLGVDSTAKRNLLKDTVELLFGTDPKDLRELSKDPTMVFIYGQGKKGAIHTMSRSLADRVYDNPNDPRTAKFVKKILKGTKYKKESLTKLLATPEFYSALVDEIQNKEIPNILYDIMDQTINEQYLTNYKNRSKKLWDLVEKVPNSVSLKFLPASAVMAGIKPTKSNLEKFGVPLSKVFEVAYDKDGVKVLTRKEKKRKTIADVSSVHTFDSANLYHTVNEVVDKQSMVVVHDEAISDVHTIEKFEKAYTDNFLKIASNYDIHEAILDALVAYSPELKETSEYKNLKKQLDKDIKAKKEILKKQEGKLQRIIGDKDKIEKFVGDGAVKEKTSTKNKEKTSVNKLLIDLGKSSSVISSFIDLVSDGKGNLEIGNKNEFDTATDTVSITKDALIEDIEHEITHAFTVPYIRKVMSKGSGVGKKERRDIDYLIKTLDTLQDKINNLYGFSPNVQKRLEYVLNQPNTEKKIGELVAVLNVESKVAQEVYNSLKPTQRNLKQVITDFINTVKAHLKTLTKQDMLDQVDPEKLYGAVYRTVENGKSFREQQYEEASSILKDMDDKYGLGNVATKEFSLKYLNYAVYSMLNSPVERKSRKLLYRVHKTLDAKNGVYSDVINKLRGIYDDSTSLQQFLHTITGEGVDKFKKADVLAQFQKITGQRKEIISVGLQEFQELTKNLSEKKKEFLYTLVHKVPLHDYFALSEDFKNQKDIKNRINKLRKKLKNISPSLVSTIDDLVQLNVNNKVKGSIYNLDTALDLINNKDAKHVKLAKELLALESLKEAGLQSFEELLKEKDLVKAIKEFTVANKLSSLNNENISNIRDSFIEESYSKPFTIKTVTKKDMNYYEESEGWKVLKLPTDKNLGVIYKEIIDSTELMGAFTDIKLATTDIDVSEKYKNDPRVVRTRTGYKYVLEDEFKEELGIVKDFSHGLVETTAHNMAIQDSQIIRDEVLKKETRVVVTDKKAKNLVDIIESNNIDNPWFVKLDNVLYAELPAEVKAKYVQVKNRASNVKNFNNEVSLVRKDISHWLLGASAKSLSNSPRVQLALKITKNLISGAKIGMVILNPMKIARDNVSNISYLAARGVSPLELSKEYNSILKDFNEYVGIKQKLIGLKVKKVAYPNSVKVQKAITVLEKQLQRNSLKDLEQKGFVNSLGSDIVSKNSDTLSGLQADIHKALEYLLINKKGNMNILGHFINQAQKIGIGGEYLLEHIGNIAKTNKTTGFMENELNVTIDRLKKIRSEEDMINYVAQYTTSPNSEAVRLGSQFTDLTDVLAKETLYRHLVNQEGYSAEEARIEVLDSFPDYKENLPIAIRQLSDMGIIMFPSFWLRIQKTIYRLAKNKPVNLSSEILVNEALGINADTIIDANIINKASSFGRIFHNPLENTGVGSVIPLHLF